MGMFSTFSKPSGLSCMLLSLEVAFSTYVYGGEVKKSKDSKADNPAVPDKENPSRADSTKMITIASRPENCCAEKELAVPYRRLMMDLLKVGIDAEVKQNFLKTVIEQPDTKITAFNKDSIVISKSAVYRDEVINFSFELKEDMQMRGNVLTLMYFSDTPIKVGNRFTMINFKTQLCIEANKDNPEVTKVKSSGSCELYFENIRRVSGRRLSGTDLATQTVTRKLVEKDFRDGAAQRLERFGQLFVVDETIARKPSLIQVLTGQKSQYEKPVE